MAGSLTPGLVARLVGVPQLPTVVAELCVTSLTATAQLGTLCTAVSYHSIAEEREKLQIKMTEKYQTFGWLMGILGDGFPELKTYHLIINRYMINLLAPYPNMTFKTLYQ